MKGWILYEGKPITELLRMQETAEKSGVEIAIINPSDIQILVSSNKEIYIDNECVSLPDFAVAAFVSDAGYHNKSILTLLESKGVLCINKASTLTKTQDKLLTLQLLSQHNIPIPKTLLLTYPYDIELINKEFGYPVVVKVIGGSKGDGVTLIESQKSLENMLQMFEAGRLQESVLIQEFIKTSKGKDIRVFIVDYEPVAAMIRSNANKDGFKSNYSAGGQVNAFELTPEIKELARKVSKVLDLNIGGIDLLFTDDGFTVCEANSMPGFEGMEKASNVNIPLEILKSIGKQLNNK